MTDEGTETTPIPVVPGVSPMDVMAIQNNVLLHQLISKTEDIQKKQESNHLVAQAIYDNNTIAKANASHQALEEHQTIARTDSLWSASRFGLRLLAIIGAAIPLLATVLVITQLLFKWPLPA